MQVNIVARQIGSLVPDWSLRVNLPALPAIGHYISVHRATQCSPHTEDVIVRRVWLILDDFQTRTVVSDQTDEAAECREIILECEVAESPWSTNQWLAEIEAARARGLVVEKFDVARLSVREDFLTRRSG